MLDTGRKRNYDATQVVSIIGQGTAVQGDIRSKGTIRVEGMVSGRVQSDDTVVVQESGRVKADLVAGQIIISGQVEGNVYAQERLEITATGRLVGDITAPRIAIAEGVLFEGKCTMKPPGELPPPPSGDVKPAAQPPQQQQRAPQNEPKSQDGDKDKKPESKAPAK